MTAAATNAVPVREVGVASGVLNLARNIGGAVGIALFGTVLTNIIESNVLRLGQDVVINTTNQGVTQLIPGLIILRAQVEGYATVFLIASAIMSLGVIAALFLKDPKKISAGERPATIAPAH